MSDSSSSIGRYTVLDELGSGGFSTVYRVRDTILGREVALKVMRPLLLSDPGFVERFQREARVMASLDHPHIIPIYDYGEFADRLCLVMKLMPGGSLGLLSENGPLPWHRVSIVTQQLASALDFAHERSLVHRDVKPHNVLFAEPDHAVLADFGLVGALESGTITSTLAGGILGTPAYVPPEIWEGETATPAADLYALACVVFNMATGTTLFDAPTPPATMSLHFRPPQFPEQWPPGVPPAIEKVLARALARAPSDRYLSAGHFAKALAALDADASAAPSPAREETVVSTSPTRPFPSAQPVPDSRDSLIDRFPRWLAPLVVLLLVLLVAGGALFSLTNREVQSPTSAAAEVNADVTVDSEEEPAPAAGDSFPAAEQITLRIFGGYIGLDHSLTQAAAERFMEQNPNVTVEVTEPLQPDQDRLEIYMALLDGHSSDVDVFPIDVIWTGGLAHHFVDLYRYGAADLTPMHFDALIENNTVDGKLVAMPWFGDAGLLYYRVDLLEKYGFNRPPATWDELEEMAFVIQEGERQAGNPDFWGYVWQGYPDESLTCNALEWIYSHGGGRIVSPVGAITINNPQAIEIVNRAAGWVGTISPPEVTDYREEDAYLLWQAGNAAFMRNWSYAFSLSQGEDSAVAGTFDVGMLPAGGSGSGAATLVGEQLAVSRYSEHPAWAADLAFFLASPAEQKIRALEGDFRPTILDLYGDSELRRANHLYSRLGEVFVHAVARPSSAAAPDYLETSTFFLNAVHAVLNHEIDAETAFVQLEQDLADILGFPFGAPE